MKKYHVYNTIRPPLKFELIPIVRKDEQKDVEHHGSTLITTSSFRGSGRDHIRHKVNMKLHQEITLFLPMVRIISPIIHMVLRSEY
ncbi:hypothetical protein ACHAWU_000261 [Discostella pseudostelligera]|uniref:Uncharacterized protein n=1 Tax=Discostella pseudostelligera TaxID=259834 RepID=A0ABD3MGW8_9STRA